MAQDSFTGCCSFPRGHKCTIIWAISLSSVGLLWSIICGSFWSWFTGIVAVAVIGTLGCVRQAKPLAIVGAVFSFLSFLLMAIAAIVIGTVGVCLYGTSDTTYYYYDDYYYFYEDNNPCIIWSVMAGLGSLLWIAPGIICLKLACQVGADEGEDGTVKTAQAVPVDVEDGGAEKVKTNTYTAGAAQKDSMTETEIAGPPSRTNRIEETPSSPHRQSGGEKFNKVKIMPPDVEEDVYVERD
eukprot:CAMPEP_0194045894 /NCGR_PEP_ID=MMETSP0009_2-20130614/18733_1 /TAXON_ID=210454 /ORGANISM="Grammatophora oceanica, Strain CCMP 410" /LENGTH=239 /DNA_ID=CAMNT_0038690931 /DNA_START=44 /DNA_END=763 /DNA_ORIENTATION=+